MLKVIQMPRAELLTFDGDPLRSTGHSCDHLRRVRTVNIEDSAELVRLIQVRQRKSYNVVQLCNQIKAIRSEGQGIAERKVW